jgi:hypothetical protein
MRSTRASRYQTSDAQAFEDALQIMVAPILSTATLPVAETLLRAIYLAITTPTSVVMSRQPSKEDAQPTMEMAPTMSMVLVTIGPTDVRFVNSKIRSEIWR